MTDRAGAGGRMPNLFVVGAMKAGTTTLYRYLSGHPGVFMSPIKEPNHFSGEALVQRAAPLFRSATAGLDAYLDGPMDQERHMAYVSDRARYLRLFRDAGTRPWRGEASPGYLFSPDAPAAVRQASPGARVVMMLREPVERAVSHYRMDLGGGVVRTSFAQAVAQDRRAEGMGYPTDSLYLAMGMYARQVRGWMEAFPADQVRVYLFDDLRSDPEGVTDDLAAFLGVDAAGFRRGAEHENRALAPRWTAVNWMLHHSGLKTLVRLVAPASVLQAGKRMWYRSPPDPGVTPQLRAELRALFAPDVAELSELVGRDLSRWTAERRAPARSAGAGA